ncbi:4-hydroxyphenylpyruvate dioxygenase [Sandaracinobacteroides saxicola]|uniref:4-hydroxyphenylpyruvate dioxygenase n=1 Tax=Sandaracinobacteroides saxicola TaxID=2759707 RepID=A0A7G5IMM9_9SPHN|nr:4-hydroxyphenylpyruvate dioxygenase [Sandaracinobacteroides saxicola]QMW24621.1 4-hydroxyphenylpyruvate dioxygenase [Sandaracinobacteroides saxicola]
MGLNGFEFVEFTSPEPEKLARLFTALGFRHAGTHRSKKVRRYTQGDINFLLNWDESGQVADFRAHRGPSANAMAFRVKDARAALAEAVRRGAEPVTGAVGPMELNIPAIRGIGGANLYLVEERQPDIYAVDFESVDSPDIGVGLHTLDHLTHNVGRGQMARWADYYERIFGFREIRYFDIQGQKTGLFSKAMTAPDNKIRIPLNESQDEHSQIEEFLKAYNGEGIQHIALATDDIFATVDALRANGIAFQDSPDTYFDLIDKRLPGHGHDIEAMRRRRILIDGAPETGGGLLLQIFTENMIGPIFFEIIQRKGNDGFGEGNFKALFESLELDQMRRGVIPAGMRA